MARAYSLVAPPTAVVPAPPPALDEILEEPHTFLVSALAHAVDAVLEVFLAPFGSGSPLQSPMLWTVLAFVRDEFERLFIPLRRPAKQRQLSIRVRICS